MNRYGELLTIVPPRVVGEARSTRFFVLKDFDRKTALKQYRLWAKLSGERPNARRFVTWMCEQGLIQPIGTPKMWDMENLWCHTANFVDV